MNLHFYNIFAELISLFLTLCHYKTFDKEDTRDPTRKQAFVPHLTG